MKSLLSILVVIILACACGTPTKLYKEGMKGKYESGQLSAADLDSLKSFLMQETSKPLNDTLIIKYDHNGETCWDMLDKSDDAYISGVMKQSEDWIRNVTANRRQISVFQFREPGDQINKLKMRNTNILIDPGYLLRRFSSKKAICGSSIIVAPSGKYLIRRSDSHFEALAMTSEAFANRLKN